jgi:Arc-like DNA binding domain
MMAKRKNIRGAGRKPQGEFGQLTSPFSLRMPEDLRKRLEVAAEKSGRSTSQELLARLNTSFARERDQNRDPAVGAICFLISQLAKEFTLLKKMIPAQKEVRWHQIPFVFRTFKLAVGGLLDALEPKKEIDSKLVEQVAAEMRKQSKGTVIEEIEKQRADELVQAWKSPEGVAKKAVRRILWHLFLGTNDPTIGKTTWEEAKPNWKPSDPGDKNAEALAAYWNLEAERQWFGFERAARDLQLFIPDEAAARRKSEL